MPTYEYICNSCGAKMEFVESIKSNPRRKCPECKRRKLQKLISKGGNVIFKGQGWTRTREYEIEQRNDMERQVSKKDCSGMTHGSNGKK